MSQIFISYAGEDKDFALRIHDVLEARSYKTWIDDRDLRGKWDFDIEVNIKNSSVLIFLASPDSLAESCYARDEIEYARRNQIKIVAVAYRTLALPIGLQRCPVVSYFDTDITFDILIDNIRHAIDKELGTLVQKDALAVAVDHLNKGRDSLEKNRYENAFRELSTAFRLCPSDYQDVLDTIMKCKQQAETAINDQKQKKDEASENAAFTVEDELAQWSMLSDRGSLGAYGIAMYALALERSGEHHAAVRQLRKACMLEPRIKSIKYMNKYYQWTEEQHRIFERILIDVDRY